MPDKHGEPTSEELQATNDRLLPGAMKTAKHVEERFAADTEKQLGAPLGQRIREAAEKRAARGDTPALLGAAQDMPEWQESDYDRNAVNVAFEKGLPHDIDALGHAAEKMFEVPDEGVGRPTIIRGT